MHVYLTARNFELTDTIRAHVRRTIVRAIQSHADAHDLNRIEIQLSSGRRDVRCACHVLVQLPGQRDINVTELHQDLHAAIDLAEKRVLRALVDLRERRLTLQRESRRHSLQKLARALPLKA